jgi:RNA polymerase sigma factor (sigma-70 family)
MGYDEAFGAIHDRYRQRLFAYTRQMLGSSRSDAEDVLQDVFLRAYGALRNDNRPVTLRAWLYRVAHNRCIDHLRRPVPQPAEIYELSRTPAHDPQAETVRREDLRRLVQDVQRLPEQQRSALLMRELDGLTYAELADALDTSVPAIKSLLVRARLGLVEAGEARDAACVDIRADLVRAHGRGVRASGRSRRHLRDCDGCRDYRRALRGVDEGIAALVPGGAGPLATVAKLLGIGGASSGAAAGAGAGAGGTAAVAGGATAATATATKVVAIVCCAAVVGGGAAEVRQQVAAPPAAKHATRHVRKATPRVAPAMVAPVKAPVARAVDPVRDAAPVARPTTKAHGQDKAAPTSAVTTEPGTGSVAAPSAPPAPTGTVAPEEAQTGGAMAPDEDAMPDPDGTGAVGAPAPFDSTTPGATATVAGEATTPSAPDTGAGAPVEQGAPMAGAAPAAPPTG